MGASTTRAVIVAMALVLSAASAAACQCLRPRGVKTPDDIREFLSRSDATKVRGCVTRVGKIEVDAAVNAIAEVTILPTDGVLSKRQQVTLAGCGEDVGDMRRFLLRAKEERRVVEIYVEPPLGRNAKRVAVACRQPGAMAGWESAQPEEASGETAAGCGRARRSSR
jgi:hypothetical protein